MNKNVFVPNEVVKSKIVILRDDRVLDMHLAEFMALKQEL
jgi:hypothetical protein